MREFKYHDSIRTIADKRGVDELSDSLITGSKEKCGTRRPYHTQKAELKIRDAL